MEIYGFTSQKVCKQVVDENYGNRWSWMMEAKAELYIREWKYIVKHHYRSHSIPQWKIFSN